MPSDPNDQTSFQADRLSRKIDRLQAGQPSPIHDGDTEDLADLARLLMERLDDAQPDPYFREQLKQDLLNPGPRLVSFRPRSGPRRYPVPALFGALTVVLVASAVTGWMAFADFRDGSGSPMNQMPRFATATPTTGSATGALVTASGIATLDPTTARNRSAAGGMEPVSTAPQATGADSSAAQDGVALAPEAAAPERAVVELPPVDSRHVELGALATVVAAPDSVPNDIAYGATIDPATIELEQTATAYQFSTPYVEPELILRGVQDFLGIEAQVDQRERGGKMVYSLSSGEGSINFTWSPESGAFSCTLPDPYAPSDIEDVTQAAVEWLQEFGFPVGNSELRPVLQTNDDGQRFIHVPLGESQLPNPAVGHPMTITLVVDAQDRIVSVSGYWLEVTSQTEASLVSAEQAWQQVRTGGGYWAQDSAPRGAGEFVAEQFEVSYMLTSAESPKLGLALQPVIAISGSFYPSDGSTSYSTTVYVKGIPEL